MRRNSLRTQSFDERRNLQALPECDTRWPGHPNCVVSARLIAPLLANALLLVPPTKTLPFP